jgi:hypothetical protein
MGWENKAIAVCYLQKLILTLEGAKRFDSKPMVLLSVANDVDTQWLVETFDFDEARDLIMLVVE